MYIKPHIICDRKGCDKTVEPQERCFYPKAGSAWLRITKEEVESAMTVCQGYDFCSMRCAIEWLKVQVKSNA